MQVDGLTDTQISMKLVFVKERTEVNFPFFLGRDNSEGIVKELTACVNLEEEELLKIKQKIESEEA